jgi:glutamyl-tRNA reductase
MNEGSSARPVAVVGCDYRRASTTWRSALVLDSAGRSELVERLREHGVDGFVQLATCNRTEWWISGPNVGWGTDLLVGQVLDRWQVCAGDTPAAEFGDPYVLTGDSAVRHVLRVAVGLESFVTGERQVAGQLYKAFRSARAGGHGSPALNLLETAVGRTVRKVQRSTALGAAGQGVHGLVARWLVEALPADGRRVAVVGMGVIGRRVAARLSEDGFAVRGFNRSAQAGCEPLSALADGLDRFDALVTCSSAAQPVVELEALAAAGIVAAVDIGSPGQIGGRVPTDSALQHADLDVLLATARAGSDATDVARAEAQVEVGVAEFGLSLGKRPFAELVERNHAAFEDLAYSALPNALDDFASDLDPVQRTQLEGALRDLLRGYQRSLLDGVTHLAKRSSNDG